MANSLWHSSNTYQSLVSRSSKTETASSGTFQRSQSVRPDVRTIESSFHSHATSFGFKEVDEEEKRRLVGDVFNSISSKLVSKLCPFPGMRHLDVAGGTGDVAFRVLDAIHSQERQMKIERDQSENDTQIFVCDINPAMLEVGQRRAVSRGLRDSRSLTWIKEDAESLHFEDSSMDGYTIAFGIRNVTHIEKALTEAYRVLRRGGRFLCLEFSHVRVPGLRKLYDSYSFTLIPFIGEVVTGDRAPYQYLVESIRRFPSQETFASMIKAAGFQKVGYENVLGGIVAIHCAFKL